MQRCQIYSKIWRSRPRALYEHLISRKDNYYLHTKFILSFSIYIFLFVMVINIHQTSATAPTETISPTGTFQPFPTPPITSSIPLQTTSIAHPLTRSGIFLIHDKSLLSSLSLLAFKAVYCKTWVNPST